MGNWFVYDREAIYKQLLSADIEQYTQFQEQLTRIDTLYLGYPYEVWLQCLDKKYIDMNNTSYVDVVTDFIATENNVINGFINGEDWAIIPMLIIHNVFDSKHRRIIATVLKDPTISSKFKDNVTNYLLDTIV